MRAIPRPKSTPSVHSLTTSSLPSSPVDRHRPELVRARSAIVPPASSNWPLAYSRRAETVEDPFSLSDFFPAHIQSREEPEWDWLREPTEDVDEESDDASNFDFGEEDLPKTPSALDAGVGDVIRREDKLGILTLNNPFNSFHDDAFSTDARLLSPYSEGYTMDYDALYDSMCALRQAHNTQHDLTSEDKLSTLDELFSLQDKPADDTYVEFGGWEAPLGGGMRLLMDLVDMQF